MDYCLALEEEKEFLRSQFTLPSMFDSVLSKQEVDLGNICVETEELSRQFAAMATDDDGEGPLTGINFDELYNFCTRQAACKSTERPAKRRKVDSSQQCLGASQGAYDASDEVIKFMARQKKTKEQRDRLVSDTQGQEGQGSTSSANASWSRPQDDHWNPRSAYVATTQAVRKTDSDAHAVQIETAFLVEHQRALLEGMKLGPMDKALVEDIMQTNALLEMAGRRVAHNTARIRQRCGEITRAAKEVIAACDMHRRHCDELAHYLPGGPDGQEALNEEHAQAINTAAEHHAKTIGSNYFKELPEWQHSYGFTGWQRERQEKYKEASHQQ